MTSPEIESNKTIKINENSQKETFKEEECENFVDHEIVAKDLSINIIKKSEGFRTKSYICPAGKRSIGYGFRYIKKSNITKKESDSILSLRYNDLSLKLDKYIKNDCLNDYQKHALVSLTYNIGINNFKRSTLLKHINKNDLHLVDKEFLKWRYAKVKGKKKVLKGLKIRRKNELKLWNTSPKDMEKDYLST
jgi:lysozyme